MPRNWGALTEARRGLMLHYDESASDEGAVQWLMFDRTCKVSYNWLILDTGRVVEIAPPDKRAWHAGVCQPSAGSPHYVDANSAFYGLAVAAKHTEQATVEQFASVVAKCVALFREHRWHADETHRIRGHNTEAWPRGRKDDPDGTLGVVISVADVRTAVAKALS